MRDKRLPGLIGSFLRAGMARAGEQSVAARAKGIPQGGPSSSLLAKIYLDRFDREMEARGLACVRYAEVPLSKIDCSVPRQPHTSKSGGDCLPIISDNKFLPANLVFTYEPSLITAFQPSKLETFTIRFIINYFI